MHVCVILEIHRMTGELPPPPDSTAISELCSLALHLLCRVTPDCAYSNLTHPSALTEPTPVPLEQPRTHTLPNSGLVILHPSTQLFGQVCHFLHTSPLIPALILPDQTLLEECFRGKWMPLTWQYNATHTNRYKHQDSWRDEEVRSVHYTGEKPWVVGRTKDGIDAVCHGWWWDEFGDWRAQVYKEQNQEKADMVVEEVERWCGEEDT